MKTAEINEYVVMDLKLLIARKPPPKIIGSIYYLNILNTLLELSISVTNSNPIGLYEPKQNTRVNNLISYYKLPIISVRRT